MNKKIYIISATILLLASVAYAATPTTIQDILVKIGLIQKQIDQLKDSQKFGGITAFNLCFLNTPASTTPQLKVGDNKATTTSNGCDTKGKASKLSLLLQIGATSTRTVFYEIQWSMDGTNWFNENTSLLQTAGTNARSHGIATTTHTITVSATTTFATTIDNVLAPHVRFNFSDSHGAANIWGIVSQQADQN